MQKQGADYDKDLSDGSAADRGEHRQAAGAIGQGLIRGLPDAAG